MTGETDLYFAVFKLADWTRTNIEYNLSTLTAEAVQTSTWVLENREGVCDELTNLFISFLRSVGIPARFVSGTVYTNINYAFGNHGWAEVYFPEIGWVPFDVTFGQYGWIDPSHVKLQDSIDSGKPSLDYSWLARNINVESAGLDINPKIQNIGNKIEQSISISVKPLKNSVGFNSYVPLEVTIKNLNDFYISSTIYISKAPGLLEPNAREVLLRPREEKKIYWTLKIPELNKDFIYTSELEAKTSFSDSAQNTIRYANNEKIYTKQEAANLIEELEELEEKSYLPDLDVTCTPDKKTYYLNDIALINCNVKNTGNTPFSNIQLCIDTCKSLDLGIAETKEIAFEIKIDELTDKIIITAKNNQLSKYSNIDIKTLIMPEISLEYEKFSIPYKDRKEFNFIIRTNTKITDIKIKINGIGSFKLDDIEGEYSVIFPIKGSSVKNNQLHIAVRYKDELNNSYDKDFIAEIDVTNTPAYLKMYDRMRKLF